MKKVCVYQVDAFTTEKFRGNPAGVVTNADDLTEVEMQTIARELNNSETAFVLSPTGPDHDVWIRFFTPLTEVPICGHATIASHYVLAREKNLPSCTVVQKTGAGVLPVEIIQEEQDYRIIMTQGKIEYDDSLGKAEQDQITEALGLNPSDRDERWPMQIVSTGHSKVLIGIKSRAVLHALRPNLAALARISGTIGCNGFYVFTLDASDVLVHGRMFAPAIGIAEDPVTGNANGPLGAYLVRHGLVQPSDSTFAFQAKQGEAIGRPGIVDVEVTLEHGVPARCGSVGGL